MTQFLPAATRREGHPSHGDTASGGRTVTPAPSRTALETAPPVTAPRGYRTARRVLLVAQVVLTAAITTRSFFFTDDLLYGSILGSAPLDGPLLVRSWFGHLVPGFIAADWTFLRIFGLNWVAASVVMVAVALAGTVALLRLLEALCGRVWRSLVATALFGLSLMVVSQVVWWGAVVTNLVPLAASIATLGSFTRWVRTGRARHLVSMAACFLVAVAFYEKSVLTAAYVGLLSLLVLDAGLPWRERVRTTLRRWPAWVLLGAIALADVAYYLGHDFIVEAGVAPGRRDMVSFLFFSFTEGLAPSFLGVHLPDVTLLGSTLLTLVVANGLLLGVAAVTALRSRKAFGAWVFFAICFLLNQGILGRGRLNILGPHMGTLLRYQLENTLLLCIALAVAAPYLRGVWPRRWVLHVRGRAVTVWAVVAVLAVLLAPYWVISLRAEVGGSQGAASRAWFTQAAASFAEQRRSNPDLEFVDGVVPNWLVYGGLAPYNRYDLVLPQVLPEATLTTSADRGLAIDDHGQVHPVDFSPEVALPADGQCLVPGTPSARLELHLPSPLPEDLWFVRVRYTAAADSAVQLILHNDAAAPGLRMAAQTYETVAGEGLVVAAPGAVPLRGVVVEATGQAEVCVQGVEVGHMQPEG